MSIESVDLQSFFKLARQVPEGDILVDLFRLNSLEHSIKKFPNNLPFTDGVVSRMVIRNFDLVDVTARLLVFPSFQPEAAMLSLINDFPRNITNHRNWEWGINDPKSIGTWVAGKYTLDGKLLFNDMSDEAKNLPWKHTIKPYLPEDLKDKDLMDLRSGLFNFSNSTIQYQMWCTLNGINRVTRSAHFRDPQDLRSREPHI